MKKILLTLVGLLMLGACATANGYALVAVDFGAAGPVQADFSQFFVSFPNGNGSGPVSNSYGGVTVTIDSPPVHLLSDRNRTDLGSNGTFTQSDLLRDFLTSAEGSDIVATVNGLIPGGIYDVQLWSFDILSSTTFLTDWSANGVSIQQDYSQNQGIPTSNDQYRFGSVTTADARGLIEIRGTPNDSTDGVRLNGLQVTFIPEPAGNVLLGFGCLAAAIVVIMRRVPLLACPGSRRWPSLCRSASHRS